MTEENQAGITELNELKEMYRLMAQQYVNQTKIKEEN